MGWVSALEATLRRLCEKWELDRPRRMFQRGRIPDPQFEPTELLYRRFKLIRYTEANPPAEDIIEILKEFVRFDPHPSANRSRYSYPNDVLIAAGKYDWGVFSFPVSAVPQQCVAGDNKAYTLGLMHAPEANNYSHSEVVTSHLGVALVKEPPPSVRDTVRTSLAPSVAIVRRPTIGERLAWLKRRLGR